MGSHKERAALQQEKAEAKARKEVAPRIRQLKEFDRMCAAGEITGNTRMRLIKTYFGFTPDGDAAIGGRRSRDDPHNLHEAHDTTDELDRSRSQFDY